MRFLQPVIASFVFLLGIIPVATAQDSALLDLAAAMPPCILQCFASDFLGPNPSCSTTDLTCLCTSETLADNVGSCVIANCTLGDSLKAANASANVCNYQSQNKQGELQVVFATFMTLSLIFLLIRLYARLFIQSDSRLGIDDWITIFNTMVWTAYSLSVLIVAIPGGLGKDDWKLTTQDVSVLSLHSFIGQVVYYIVNASTKLVLLFFYLRIFPEKNTRRILLGTIVVIVCYAVAFGIAGINLCRPVDYFWRQWTEDSYQGHCSNYLLSSYIYSGLGLFFDVVIMVVPLYELRKLNMSWKRKISVGLMFSVGTVIVAVSIARFITILNFSFTSGFSTSWTLAQIYTTIEVNVGIICTCFPSFRLLLMHFFPQLLGSTLRPSRALYENKYSAGGSKTLTNMKMGSQAGGGRTATAVSVLSTGKHGVTDDTDAIYIGKESEIELTNLPVSPRRQESTDTRLYAATATLPPSESQGGRWIGDYIEHRPVSKENFV